MKAVVKRDVGQVAFVTNREIPRLRNGYILVKTGAVALNPIDWMKADLFPAPDSLLGHDYAGEVVDVGADVTRPFSKGDRVFGYTIGGDHRNPENGAFAEYIVAKADVQQRVPDSMSLETAASLGAALNTANMALFMKLGLIEEPAPVEPGSKNQFVFIYGGSTSSAALAIQLAVRSGYTVVTTCSPHNFETAKALGASHVFDYKGGDCGALIRKLTGDRLTAALDTISTPSSAQICADALSSKGGRCVQLLPIVSPRKDVEALFMDATTMLGEYYEYGPDRVGVAVDPAAFAFAKAHVDTNESMLQRQEIRAHEIEMGDGGLQGVILGMNRLRDRAISGKKLVYTIS